MRKPASLKGRATPTGGRGRQTSARAVITPTPRIPPIAAPLGMALVALLFALWGLAHLRGYTYIVADWIGPDHPGHWSDYDEGVYVVSARLLNHGYTIFSQVFSSQPPLFLAGLAVVLRLSGDAAGAGHLYSLICGLVALGGVAWLCWETLGRRSALLAVALLAVSPGFVIASRAVEAEAPMLALSSLSVAAAARYARTGGRGWLAGAGLALAAATLSKLLAVSAVVPLAAAIGLCALDRGRAAPLRRLVPDLLLAAVCAGGPILASFALLSPSQQYDQVVRFHLKASAAQGVANTSVNGATFSTFFAYDPGLVGLVITGVAALVVARRPLPLLQVLWLLATLLSMVSYHPLFIHHLTVLLPPMAAVAAASVAFFEVPDLGRVRQIVLAALLAAGVLAYLVWIPATVGRSGEAFQPDRDPVKAARVAWLRANSRPGDLVVVDDQVLAVAADRLVPPALSDTSTVRALSGYLSVSHVERATADPRVRAVLLTRTFKNQPMYRPYVRWLNRHFRRVHPRADLQGLAYVRRYGP